MHNYILRSFDGRHGLPQTFTSLTEAKKAAKRIFHWQRLYTSDWFGCYDLDEYYSAIQLSDKPSAFNGENWYAPVIERRAKKIEKRNKIYEGLF